ncbi:MAG: sigma-70 family RNA polymerase sigma factor [Bryobacteraceae bacterium]
MAASTHAITHLLVDWGNGDSAALSRLIPLVYTELHRLARSYMRREQNPHLLQPTALVNEAYLRLIDSSRVGWRNRTHFFAVSAQLMRRILVDFARSRQAQKRGGTCQSAIEEAFAISSEPGRDLVALDDALTALAVLDPRKSKVVELRFFGGLSAGEAAEVLLVSPQTVLRDWRLAKVWLMRELDGKSRESGTMAAG